MNATSFTSKAWLLDGPVDSLPGLLHLENGKLTFLMLEQGTFSTKRFGNLLAEAGCAVAERGEDQFPIEYFSIPLDAIRRFHIPWYSFGAGGGLETDRKRYRFSFVKPQNTVEPTYFSEGLMQWRGGAGQEEVNILEGRASGKIWKALLNSRNG
ncbi:hypothetical protein [Pontiella agarivorans]|uniref:Uncharacterized protein n=1 Tax=Pontiella agarivorans TaxID=3038953 RepID=A0ABU5MWC9_9BACT|nr:hypothetical protein [Pontiella agarivorans]MDZ8118534.1 hypothetical protein [Pontiella agarivorans]